MGVVELAIVDPNTLTERHRVLAELLAGLGVEKFKPDQLTSDAFGKPYLELDKRQIGYSFSNARHEDGSFGLMALVDGFAVGVDIELWPRRSNDKDFLESIASPEDEAMLGVLSAGGYDASIALLHPRAMQYFSRNLCHWIAAATAQHQHQPQNRQPRPSAQMIRLHVWHC